MKTRIQKWRTLTQSGFFILFLLAPPLDIFRYDLTRGHFIVLGLDWTLQLDGSQENAAFHVLFFGLLPVVSIAAAFLYVAWRWGRLYCGWLCPHYSVIEIINRLMIRASGKPGIWEKKKLPEVRLYKPEAQRLQRPDTRYWIPTIVTVVGFAFIWAVSLLTYLLPPFEIYHNLLAGELTRNQGLFIGVATALLSLEFLAFRHLFCRYGCAVGLFQSLAWMANRRAMVISFDTSRAHACRDCNNACDNVCPMRLQPRTLKRRMFTCTECGECLSACAQVQQYRQDKSLLHWVQGEAAARISEPPVSEINIIRRQNPVTERVN